MLWFLWRHWFKCHAGWQVFPNPVLGDPQTAHVFAPFPLTYLEEQKCELSGRKLGKSKNMDWRWVPGDWIGKRCCRTLSSISPCLGLHSPSAARWSQHELLPGCLDPTDVHNKNKVTNTANFWGNSWCLCVLRDASQRNYALCYESTLDTHPPVFQPLNQCAVTERSCTGWGAGPNQGNTVITCYYLCSNANNSSEVQFGWCNTGTFSCRP